MNETCDRCGPAVGAGYRVDRVNRAGELYLCGQCASRHWRALSAQGWTFWSLGVHAPRTAGQCRITRQPGPGRGVAAGAGAAAGHQMTDRRNPLAASDGETSRR